MQSKTISFPAAYLQRPQKSGAPATIEQPTAGATTFTIPAPGDKPVDVPLAQAKQAIKFLEENGNLTQGGIPLPVGEFIAKLDGAKMARIVAYNNKSTGQPSQLFFLPMLATKDNGSIQPVEFLILNENDMDTILTGEEVVLEVYIASTGDKRARLGKFE